MAAACPPASPDQSAAAVRIASHLRTEADGLFVTRLRRTVLIRAALRCRAPSLLTGTTYAPARSRNNPRGISPESAPRHSGYTRDPSL